MANSVDWKEVYSKDMIYAPNCWKTCEGYCCKNFYGKYQSVLDNKGVALPMLESEYAHYKAIGGIENIPKPAQKRTFTLENGKSFNIYVLSCTAGGLCNPHGHRPLICRIYPYFPVLNEHGDILDFEFAALMDLFYSNPKKFHKCTLVRERDEQVKADLRKNIQPLLQDPEVIFVFMCLKALVDRLKDKMDGHIDGLDDAQMKKFINKYEWMVLSGKPWRDSAFSQQISQIYERVKKAHGNRDFL